MTAHTVVPEVRELMKLSVAGQQAALKLKNFLWLDTKDSDSMCSALVAIGARPSQYHPELDQLALVVRLLRDGP
jgi:hypothetical protein